MKRKLRKFAAIIFTAILTFSTVGNNALTVFAADEALFEEAAAQAEAEAQAAAEAAAQAEAERIAQEQAAEAERIAQEQAAKAEAERIAQEQAAEAERLAQEQAAAEAAAKAEAERIAQEQAAAEAAKAETEAKAAAEAEAKAAAEAEAKAAAEAEAKAEAEAAAKEEEEKAAAEEEEASEEETKEDAEEEEEETAEPEVTEEDFTVTITYEASEGGSVSVEEETLTWKKITTIDENGKKTVETEPANVQAEGATAKADEDYEFRGWTLDGKTVSEKETFVPSVPEEDTTYKAQFLSKDGDFPAQSFKGETADVSVSASVDEGVFPEGTEMKVAAVEKQVAIDAAQEAADANTEIVDAVAVDITFHHDGKEIQPQGAVNVRLTAKRKLAGENHEAITIDGSGNAEAVAGASSRTSAFDTDHFTVYGIIGTEYIDEEVDQYIRHRYEFYVGKPGPDGGSKPDAWGWTIVASQIVKDGDKLQFPSDPAGDAKYTFEDWYLTDEHGEYAGKVPETVTIDPATMPKENAKAGDADEVQQVVKVFAKFDTRYKVTFYAKEKGPDDGGIVLKTELVKDGKGGETVSLLDREAAAASGLIPEDGKVLVAWKDAYGNTFRIDGTDGKGAKVTVDGEDIELYPVFEDAHNVRFDLVLTKVFPEKIPDQVVENGKKIEDTSGYEIDEVYRFYKFGGWYLDENYNPAGDTLNDKFTGNPVDLDEWVLSETDAKDIVLHAKWIPDTVKFTVTPFREAQNEAVYEEIHEDAQEIEWEADKEFPIDKILEAFPDKKYNNSGQSTIGVCHYSGTGAFDDNATNGIFVNGAVLPAFQVFDKKGNMIATYNAKTKTLSGEVDRDSIGSVRVNYNRDRYHLYFLFTGAAEDKNKTTTLGGYTGSLTMSDAVKEQAPEGWADESLPTNIIVKHAQHLYKVTHLVYNYGSIFDPFMRTVPWYYERKGMSQVGQTIFDETNGTFPVKPANGIGDGGSVAVVLYTNGEQKAYTYIHCYYDNVSSWDEVKQTNAQKAEGKGYTKKLVYKCNYHDDGKEVGHKHSFELGKIGEDGYRAVAVTNQAAHKLTGRWDESGEAVWSGSGVQNVTVASQNGFWDGKSNNVNNNSGDAEPVYIHYVPTTFTVTFKQTRDGSVGGGFDVADASKEDDVTIRDIYSGTALKGILEGDDAPDWQTLTDNRDVTYKALPGWKCVQYPDGIPEKMPAKDLTFYKEWETEQFIVTLNYGYDDLIEHKTDIAYGSAVPLPDEDKLDRDDYTLIGWKFHERNADATKGAELPDVSFHSIVTRDLYAEAQWVPDKGFIVEYRAGDHGEFGGQETKKDPAVYRSDSAPVNYMPEPFMDYVFVGYKILDKDGGLHDLDNPKTVDYHEEYDLAAGDEKVGKIVLVAQYEKAEYKTTVIYHANYPGETGDRKVEYDSYVTNNTFKVKDITDVGFQSIYVDADGSAWQFDGWSNKKDAHTSGFDASEEFAYFKPDDKAAAGDPENKEAKGANDLWAVWKVIENEIEVTVTKVWSDADDADGIRPASVTVRIAGGDVDQTLTLTASDWKATLKLPKYNQSGNEISGNLAVTEESVPAGYTASVSGNVQNGFTVTNTHTPVTPPTPTPTPPTPVTPTPWYPIPILTTTTTTTTTPATPTATEQVPAMPPAGDPNDIPAPLPVAAEAPAVLGVARRTTAMEPVAAQVRNYDEPAVLGSRRGKTGEGSDAQKAMTILAAGMIAVALSKDKRKKYR